MTGGRIVVLGDVGRNFGAGMSGGIAYILPTNEAAFKAQCNIEMIEFAKLEQKEEMTEVRKLIMEHYEQTNSSLAQNILENWEQSVSQFVKVVPTDYQKMIDKINFHKMQGLTEEKAEMQAFVETTASKELAKS